LKGLGSFGFKLLFLCKNILTHLSDYEILRSNNKERTMQEWEIQRHLKNEESKKKVKEAVEVIVSEINLMGNETNVEEGIKEALSGTHRTLQQGFFRSVIVPAISFFVEMKEKSYYDLRSEDACNCAEKMKPIIEDSYFRFV